MKRYLTALFFLLTLMLGAALAQSERAVWQNLELTNARTGETFRFADFEGKTVYVEPMATWCTNCNRQLKRVSAAQPELSEDVVLVALSVAENISDEDLKAYTERHGFDFTFAVATPELLQGLIDQYGRAVTSPPSVPHFIIRPDGSTTELELGGKTPEELIAELSAVSN